MKCRFALIVHQRGMTTVEFALVGTVLFMVLFGVIEFGRLLFTWNVLDEAARRAARLAAVCPVTAAGQSYVRSRGSFDGNLLPGFSDANIRLRYLEEDGITPAAFTQDTYYVQASIINYRHQMLIPFFDISLDALDFSTTLPAESLGVHPVGDNGPQCTLP